MHLKRVFLETFASSQRCDPKKLGNTGANGGETTTSGSTGANTADTNAPILYGILVALAGAAIVTLGVRRRVIRR